MNEGIVQYASFVHMRKMYDITFVYHHLFYTPRVERILVDQRHLDKAYKRVKEQFCFLADWLRKSVAKEGEEYGTAMQGSRPA